MKGTRRSREGHAKVRRRYVGESIRKSLAKSSGEPQISEGKRFQNCTVYAVRFIAL